MSGGSLDYGYQKLQMLADDIECSTIHFYDEDELTEIQKQEVKNEIEDVVRQLRQLSERAHDIEWWFSGDYGDKTFYNKMKTKPIIERT
jgi:hypothetical protein